MFELNPDRKTFIDSVNGRTVIIIDDFYKNPDEVRNLALTSERRRDPKLINGLPGSRVFVETDELKKHVKPFFDELCLSDIWRTNIDEKMYEFVSSTLSWLYHEAPFLRTTLSVFDLPGIIGAAHAQMCHVLCSGGLDCTYSNDFHLYQQLGRGTILKYLASISLYYVIFAVPLAGNVFGMWLAIALNFLNSQYDEGFSSLRIEHWKNFLR